MPKLLWDQVGERLFENGIKEVALYVFDESTKKYGNGVAWNGVTAFTLSPEGAESTPLYANDSKYLNLISAENMNATIEAYMSPEEFDECDGSRSPIKGMRIGQQARKTFALCAKTTIGNDMNPNAGFKFHVLYGCIAAPSERAYATINEDPEAMTLSWEISTTPVEIGTINGVEYKPTAYVELDSTEFTEASADKFQAVMDKFYGSESEEPTLMTPAEIYAMLSE